MAGELLNRGLVQLTIEDLDCHGGLAIALTQTRLGTALPTSRYLFEVRVKVDDGMFLLGKFSTSPPDATSPATRIVATAACPGALAYILLIRPWQLVAGEPDSYGDLSGMVNVSVGDPGGQLPGVVRVGERAKYYAATPVGVVTIPAGERVLSWSAFSTGAVASVQIGAGPVINIPPNGVVSGGLGGIVEGPTTFTFAGADFGGYYIETAESA